MLTAQNTATPFRKRRQQAMFAVLLPLLLALSGCPADTASAPGSASANQTAPALTPQQASAQQQHDQETKQLLAANQHTQRVQQVISQAEASYKSGVDNYNANRLDAARLDFDFAVDSMLTSGLDLKNEAALADEFDNLISKINSLEMVALKQGNGFSPKQEAAPLDAANDVTFPPDAALVGKVTEQLRTTQSDLPLVVNEFVAGWINAFTNSPARHATLVRSLNRAGKYKAMISKILSDNGVPQDLIYQAVAESGFQPQALNARSGAGGMWQFMPFGGYGLARNGYFDERFDPQKSTVAYAKYMKTLYNQFGDWYLAMAAYDWGPGNVQRVVSRTGYADFWELYRRNVLPAETKNYVPGILAAIIMAKNPQQYGLTELAPDAPVLSDTITTTYAIDLRLVADVTDSTVAEIVALNPALLRLSTPNDISYDLHIPPGAHDLYKERLKDIPEDKRATWRFHVVKPGETLESISTALHARPDQVATYNAVTAANPLAVDDELVVPVTTVTALAGQQRYTMRKGDTLVSVADRFDVSVEQLRSWNHLSSSRSVPGHSLYVAEPLRLAPTTHITRGRHTKSTSSHNSSGASRTSSHSSHGHTASAAPANTHSSSHSTAHASSPTKKKSTSR